MNKLNLFSIILVLLLSVSVSAYSLDEQNEYWKPIFVNSGYATDNSQVNIYVYTFDQDFASINAIENGEYVVDAFVDDLKENSLVDETTQVVSAAGAIAKGSEVSSTVSSALSPASKFIAKFSKLNIPAGEFTTIKQAIQYAESGKSLAPYMTSALTKYNLVYDEVSGVLKFTDTIDDISIIPRQISFSNGATASKVLSALKKATNMGEFKGQMVAYKKIIEVRDGIKSLSTLKGAAKTAKASELSSLISKLRNSGALSDEALKAAGFVNASGDVGQTLSTVALGSGDAAKNLAKFNSVVASVKPTVTSRVSTAIASKSSKFMKGTGKIIAKTGLLAIPTAIGRSAAEITLAANLPDVAAPNVDVFSYSDEGTDRNTIGAEIVIDPQFSLNVQRYKSMREELDKSIDEMGGLANGAWEVMSFFDPTELGWMVAEKLPALSSIKEEFIVEENGCTISIITNVSKEQVDEYVNAQKDFICLITDITEEKAKAQLFLPKGNFFVIANSKMTQEMVNKVVDTGSLIPTLPKPLRQLYNNGDKVAVKDYLISAGFPSLPTKIEVTNPIILSTIDSDNLSIEINFSSGKTILDYFRANSSITTTDEIKNVAKLYTIENGAKAEVELKNVTIAGNKLTLTMNKGIISEGKNFELLFDTQMNSGVNKLSLTLNNVKKIN